MKNLTEKSSCGYFSGNEGDSTVVKPPTSNKNDNVLIKYITL